MLSLGFPLSVVVKSRCTRHGDIGSIDTGSALESNSSVSDSGVSESVSEVGLSLSLPLSVVKVAGNGHVSGIDTGSTLESNSSVSESSVSESVSAVSEKIGVSFGVNHGQNGGESNEELHVDVMIQL